MVCYPLKIHDKEIRGDLKDTKRRTLFKEGIVALKSNMVQAKG